MSSTRSISILIDRDVEDAPIRWIDVKYANLVSPHLPGFQIKNNSPYLANFRCVLCGDSQKHKQRKRGFLVEKSKGVFYFCHNGCGSRSLQSFLKDHHPTLYKEYIFERFREERVDPPAHVEVKMAPPDFQRSRVEQFFKFYPGCRKVSSLAHDHPVKKYVDGRLIPAKHQFKLFCCLKYYTWANSVIPNSFKKESLEWDEPRLVIPFLDKGGNVFAVQGRSFKKNSTLRYATAVFDKAMPLIYGLDTVDVSQDVYVVEGPIDSLFVDNAIAIGGARNATDVHSVADRDKLVYVFDNEPRKPEITSLIERHIQDGFRVVVWPSHLKGKDINKMVMDGELRADRVTDLLRQNTYGGLEAHLLFNQWRKA